MAMARAYEVVLSGTPVTVSRKRIGAAKGCVLQKGLHIRPLDKAVRVDRVRGDGSMCDQLLHNRNVDIQQLTRILDGDIDTRVSYVIDQLIEILLFIHIQGWWTHMTGFIIGPVRLVNP